jgi:hypothetical protein
MLKTLLDAADRLLARLRAWGGMTVPDDQDATDSKSPPAPSADPYGPAVDRLRGTSDSIVRALAAIGALLIVGVQFSNIGGLEWTGWTASNRLLWALLAVGVGFVGVGLALLVSVGVDNAGDIALSSIVKTEQHPDRASGEMAEIWAKLQADESWKAGHADFADMEQRYNEAVKIELTCMAPDTPPNKRSYYQSLVAYYNTTVLAPVLGFSRYVAVRREFRRSRWKLLGAAITVGFAIGLFAWATNEPNDEPSDPSAFQTPVSARVLLPSQEEQARVRGIVGDSCLPEGTASIEVILLNLDDDRASVVTLPSAGGQCGPKSFTVDRANITPVDPIG